MARAPIMADKAFPRGGSKPLKLIPKRSNFGASQLKKKKGKKKRKHGKSVNNEFFHDGNFLEASNVEELSCQAVKPGMLLLGCVSSVASNKVELSIAGGIRATVTAAHISDTYSRRIMSQDETVPFLTDIFVVDELYPLKIVAGTERSNLQFIATLEPKEVNSKLIARDIRRGMILTGEVTSKEDHGYIISLGVANVKSFLLNDKVPEGATYHEGQLIRCCVVRTSELTINLSTLKKDLETAVVEDLVPVDCFIPGMQFSLNVTSCFKSGLKVSLVDQNSSLKGYIYSNHLRKVFDKSSNYEAGLTLDGVLLYVVPLVNYPFFRVTNPDQPPWKFNYGDITSGKVSRVNKSGIYLRIGQTSQQDKCFVPLVKLRESRKILNGEVELKDIYPIGKVMQVRITNMARLSRFYRGAANKESLQAKIFSTTDLKVGMVVTCTIVIIGDNYSTVDLGNGIKGFVPLIHMTENAAKSIRGKFKEGQIVKARILSIKKSEGTHKMLLTLKPSLVKSKEPILLRCKGTKHGTACYGTVMEILPDQLTVSFYGSAFGTVLRRNMPISHGSSISANYYVGQVVKCYVIGMGKGNLKLSLVNNADVSKLLTIGYQYPVVVESVAPEGVYVEVIVRGSESCSGFIPLQLLSRHTSLIPQLVDSICQGQKFNAHCIHIDPLRSPPSLFTTHSLITNFLKGLQKGKEVLVPDAVMPFFYLPCDNNKFELTPVVPADVQFVTTTKYKISDEACNDFDVVIGKIKEIRENRVIVSTDIKDVWDHHFMSSLKDLNDFLEEVDVLHQKLAIANDEFKRLELGKEVQAVPKIIDEEPCVLSIDACCLEGRSWKKFTPSTIFKARITWISHFDSVVWVHPIVDGSPAATREKRATLRARVVHVSHDVVVAEAVGSRELVFIPTRRHFNDKQTFEHAYTVGEITKLRVFRLKKRLIGIDRQIVSNQEKGGKKLPKRAEDTVSSDATSSPVKKKRKTMKDKQTRDEMLCDADIESNHSAQEEQHKGIINFGKVDSFEEDSVSIEFVKEGSGMEPSSPVKLEVISDDEAATCFPDNQGQEPNVEVKEESDAALYTEKNSNYSSSESDGEREHSEKVSLDVGFDWSLTSVSQLDAKQASNAAGSSSSEEEEVSEDKAETKKHKRLTVAGRKEKAREMEERIRSLENRRLDPTRAPQCADDFDRLVVATPDDSSLWLQYMAHHLENTEIEKARAVARRALKTINIMEEQDKLNVWFALLNLEQLYGSPESQKVVFEEALRSNDSYKVHLHKLSLLANNGASVEVEKLAGAMVRKFKEENESVWWDVGGLLMKVGKMEAARNILQRAMASLPNTKHVSLITRFAQLENKYGSSERAQTLYEHILSAFPKRVDVWSAYADLMVKSNRVDLARQILERATSQSLPPKKMKVLFKKFIAFEESHGTPDDSERVRSMAGEYLES